MGFGEEAPHFNLIVTHLPGRPAKARALRDLRGSVGEVHVVDSRPNVLILLVRDALEAVRLMRERLPRDTPILRAVPVMASTLVIVDYVERSVRRLVESVEGESFAVRLDGKLYDSEGRILSRSEAIDRIASVVDKRVDLTNPDILVYVKTVKVKGRSYAAIYVGDPRGIMSTVKEWG